MERLLVKLTIVLMALSFLSYFFAYMHGSITTNAVLEGWGILDSRAISGVAELSVAVDGDGPNITIYRPENRSYAFNTSVPLRVQVNDTANVSIAYYNINNGANITLVLDAQGINVTTISTPEGSNILRVFANDTLRNLRMANVAFVVNNSRRYEINWSKFYHADSTNLSLLNSTQIENLANLTLSVENFGKIIFNDIINLTAHTGDDIIDLDSNVIITSNFIFVNVTVFPNLNRSANITLKNLTFVNPRILLDGAVCPASLCERLSYSGGTLVSKVAYFSSYEAEEGSGPGDSGGSGSTGGGGGGGGGGGRSGSRIIIQLSEPVEIVLGLYGRAIFTIALGGKLADHGFTITSINRGTGAVTLRFDSVNQFQLRLAVNEERNIDLDGDGMFDITLGLIRIEGNLVRLKLGLYKIAEPELQLPIPREMKSAVEEQPRSTRPSRLQRFFRPENEARNALYLLITMGLVMAIIFFERYISSKSKGRSRRR